MNKTFLFFLLLITTTIAFSQPDSNFSYNISVQQIICNGCVNTKPKIENIWFTPSKPLVLTYEKDKTALFLNSSQSSLNTISKTFFYQAKNLNDKENIFIIIAMDGTKIYRIYMLYKEEKFIIEPSQIFIVNNNNNKSLKQ